jgi:hypothetical protein
MERLTKQVYYAFDKWFPDSDSREQYRPIMAFSEPAKLSPKHRTEANPQTKNVYLVGCHHNYDRLKDVKVTGTRVSSISDDVNQFKKDYLRKGKRWHDPIVNSMEKSYIQADRFFKTEGRKIYNKIEDRKFEVFERIDYEQLF